MGLMVLSVKNDNKFSYKIRKNPNSPMTVKEHKNGYLFYWFKDVNTFCIYFEDGVDKLSYPKKGEAFEYLDKTRYVSAWLYFDMINNVLSTILKEEEKEYMKEYDNYENDEYELWTPQIEIQAIHNLYIFQRYYKTFGVELEFDNIFKSQDWKIYEIKFKSNNLHRLIKLAFIFFLYNIIFNNDYLLPQKELIAKVLRIVNELDLPYFIRYLIKKNLIRNEKDFNEFKEELEKTDKYKINFVFEDSWEARYKFVLNHIDLNQDIVDYGCGEGKMVLRLARRLNKENKVIGVDIDTDLLKVLRNKANAQNLNVETIYIEDNYEDENVIKKIHEIVKGRQVILAEVIEHNEYEQAVKLVKTIIDGNPLKVIITTPNREFNQFFEDDNKSMRHEDHKFELSKEEFEKFINECIKDNNYDYKVIGFGDSVNDIYMQLGCVIQRTV